MRGAPAPWGCPRSASRSDCARSSGFRAGVKPVSSSGVVGWLRFPGGLGSPVGSAIGALIYGMTVQGIVYAGWDPNWFRFFLGLMLLLAVLLNLTVKRISERV